MTKDQMYAAAALSKQYELLDILRKHVNNLDTLTFNGTQSLSNINDEREILNILSKYMSIALDEYELKLNNELSNIDNSHDIRLMPF